MNNVDRLLASHDGRVPPRLLTAASALDRAEARCPRAGCRIASVTWKPAGIVERMAHRLLDLAGRNGCATRMDLKACGFTWDEIERYGARAVARAAALLREGEAA